jgi:hypothetical protein
MGIKITIGGYPFQAVDYSVEEAATPLAAGDSSGSVGSVTFRIPGLNADDFEDVGLPPQNTGQRKVLEFGAQYFLDEPIRLSDSRKGFTLGTVNSVGYGDDGTISFTCLSRLADLNAYGIQAEPFVGTLEAAFDYYLGLAGVETDWFVDESIASRAVVFPGWSGELWYRLKQIAAAQDCDISLVSGIILLRPIRARIAARGRDISRSKETGVQTLAQAVEVYQYDNRAITDELVYPPGGWTPEVQVLNVNAGESTEYTLELSASVSAIQTPTHQTFVSEDHDSSSVYTVIANDGFPVSASLWRNSGGKLEVSIKPDTTSLLVRLTGATNVPTREGNAATNFSIALASDATGNRYSTLRILGTGVAFNKVKKRIRTGVPATKTGTEIGVTIDNPFISNKNDLYRTGTRAAKQYAGQVPSLSGSVIAVNQRGDSGVADYPTYGEVETALKAELGTPTYGDVESYYTGLSLTTYGEVRQYWFSFVRDDFTNQVFGNVNGARIFDRVSRRWYRIRTATLQADRINFTADDDLTHGDIEAFHAAASRTSRTYGDVQLILNDLTYKRAELVGLYGG